METLKGSVEEVEFEKLAPEEETALHTAARVLDSKRAAILYEVFGVEPADLDAVETSAESRKKADIEFFTVGRRDALVCVRSLGAAILELDILTGRASESDR